MTPVFWFQDEHCLVYDSGTPQESIEWVKLDTVRGGWGRMGEGGRVGEVEAGRLGEVGRSWEKLGGWVVVLRGLWVGGLSGNE